MSDICSQCGDTTCNHNRNVIARLAAERDELQGRIDKVMALNGVSPLGIAPEGVGFNRCLAEVRAILAPKQEARFTVESFLVHRDGRDALDWQVMCGDKIIVEFTRHDPDAEAHAREWAAKLNGASDE